MAKKYASEIVSQAKKWLGRNEADGTHKLIIDTYNSHKPLARGYAVKYSDEWCATFVSAVAIKCGFTDIIPTECGCEPMVRLFKEMGCWAESDSRKPSAGDIIFYDWDDSGSGNNKGNSDHVGIVEKVSGNTITVIEGNKGEAVARRTIAVDGRYIRGYGVPKYDKKTTTTTAKKETTTAAKTDTKTLKKGAKVKIKAGAKDLNTGKKYAAFVYLQKYTIISVSGDRVVFGKNGVVTGATSKANIKLV